MDKDKIKAQLGEAAVKTKAAMSEIKANFKADEGTTGFRKIQSMFINLWKSGTTGRVALVASGVVCVLLLFSFFGGGGSKSANGAGTEGGFDGGATASAASKKAVPKDTLVVKGLYMRMPADDALEVCKELAAKSADLVVVDLRNGIEIEREFGLEKYKKREMALYYEHMEKRSKMINNGVDTDVVNKKYHNYTPDEWLKTHPPSEADIAESKKKVKEVVGKNNLIKIAIKKDGIRKDKLQSICNVWIDNQGNTKEVTFNEMGMDRFFNAGDLSLEEFAKALVKNYPGIPSLTPKVEKQNPGRGFIQNTTWGHKDPKGYRVELFERAYFNNNGVKYSMKMVEKDPEVAMALSLTSQLPSKRFSIIAIKPESERKFD